MNFWQTKVIGDLKAYKDKKKSVKQLEARLEELNSSVGNVAAIDYSKERTTGGGVHDPMDQWINDLVLREEIEKQLRAVRFEIYHIEEVLNNLEEEERTVLTSFYISRCSNYIDKLVNSLHLEKSSIYRLKDKALERYTLLAYGVTSYK